MISIPDTLAARAEQACELCTSSDDLRALRVAPFEGEDDSTRVLVCGVCAAQQAPDAALDDKHWYCLQTSIWSEHAPVQVIAWRTLSRLQAHGWAQDLLSQTYLDEEVLAWAQEDGAVEEEAPPVDCNGAVLERGDTVSVIKDLKVKGSSMTVKQGTMVRNIRLTRDPEHIEGRVNEMAIMLKTCFLKKSSR